MNAPLKPTAMNALTSSAHASSTVLNDLVSRMNAQTGGAMQDEQKAAFSKWLERHSSTATSMDAVKPPVKAPSTEGVSTPSKNAEPTKAVSKSVQPNNGPRKSEQVGSKNTQTAAKAVRKDGAHAANKATEADKSDASGSAVTDPDEVTFVTPLGEGSALVRELQPPADVQRSDPSSMMAWLSSLTQSDAKLAQAQADAQDPALSSLGKSEGRNDTSSNVVALHSLLSGRGGDKSGLTATTGTTSLVVGDATAEKADKVNGTSPGLAGAAGGALDISAWQRSAAMAQLSESLNLQANGAVAAQQSGDVVASTDLLAGSAAAQATQTMRGHGFELTAATKHVSETLSTPVQSPQFADALAERVSMYVRGAKDDGPMTAELHLNPAELGPINVKISLDGQSAHVDFAAAALETRQAIEASMPLLSSSLNEVGLSLTGGGVSSQTGQQGFGQSSAQSDGSGGRQGGSGTGRGRSDDDGAVIGRTVNVARLSNKGGLDLYA